MLGYKEKHKEKWYNIYMKSIFDIDINSAEGTPKFLEQYRGKAVMVVNTTVGCGNANQLEVLQWLQDKYGPNNFEIVAIPTNDYCGPGITKGKWSDGITCGMDSKNYGVDQYNVTFNYSEMVGSNPNSLVSEVVGKNGLGQDHKEPHDLYKEIKLQSKELKSTNRSLGIFPEEKYYSWWLNLGFDDGEWMGGNYEKYLFDKDGYLYKHYTCTVLNYDVEKTLKENMMDQGKAVRMGLGRSKKIFEEEYGVVCNDIEDLISGKKSVINPNK